MELPAKILFLIIAILAAPYLIRCFLQFVGDYLVVRHEPDSSDCIVILSGDKSERVAHGINLYRLGFAKRVILSGGPGQSDYPEAFLMKTQAISGGIDEKDIITEHSALSTYENALNVKRICEEHRFTRIILVTSPYHSRRAYIHFKERFPDDTFTIISCPAEDAWYNPHEWWTRPRDLERTIQEYISFIWHLLWKYRDRKTRGKRNTL